MKKLFIIPLIALLGCDQLEKFALPDHAYKNTVVLHTIEKGAHKSNNRGPSPVNGDGVKFNFNFQEVAIPKDSAIQKLYGLSDSFSHHLKYSPRIGFRVRQDSTIDIFAFWHMDGKFSQQYLGTVNLYDWHYAAVEIERDFYEFRFNEKVFRVYGRTKDWLWGFKYRLFPNYDDGEGNGAPGRTAIAIEEK